MWGSIEKNNNKILVKQKYKIIAWSKCISSNPSHYLFCKTYVMYLNPLATIGKKVDIPQTIHNKQPPKCQHGNSIQFKKKKVTKTLHIQ
jgi:hypothetical protein